MYDKKYIRRLLGREVMDSDTYINYLRQKGMRIGEGTVVFDTRNVDIDGTRPWMIEIGDDVKITRGVIILTHGFDWSVMKGTYGEVLGSCGKVTIGNNVFIGMNSIILKGVTIGNNVIIGAGSMTLDEYYEKRKKRQEQEAKEMVREYRAVYGKDPDESVMDEFFWLFTDTAENLPERWEFHMNIGGNREFSAKRIREHKKQYQDMEDFFRHC